MFEVIIGEWKFENANCVIKKNIGELCNSCDITIDNFEADNSFFDSEKVEVFYLKNLMFSGFVDNIRKKGTGSDIIFLIESRCNLAKLVDCDFSFVKSNTSFFDLLKYLQKTFDFEYKSDSGDIAITECNYFGDNIFYVLGDIARRNNLILFSDSHGRLNIKKLKSGSNATLLDEKQNLIEYEFIKNQSAGFGKYYGKNSKITSFIIDANENEKREKIIIDNSVEGSEGLDKIINLEKMKNNISNIIGVVRFNNWIGENVFEINQKIYCDFPSFNKEKKRYLIAGLEFRSSDFTTEITLINL